MKRVLLSSFLIACAFFNKVNAQCTITNVSIAPTNVTGTGCTVTFNLAYTADVNPGSKYVIVHLWKESNYPSPAYTSKDYPLPSNKTNNMIGTLIISDPGRTPSLSLTWPSDMKSGTTPNSPILNASFNYSTVNGKRTYSFTNITATIPGACTSEVGIVGDVWATQSAQNASCIATGAIDVVVNEPLMRGNLFCSTPRTFTIGFQTLSNKSITFSAYKDANENGVFDQADRDAGKLNLSGGGISGTKQDVTISNASGGFNTYGPYSYDQQTAGSTFSIFVVARAGNNDFENVLLLENSCTKNTLPVNFKSFTATRSNSTNNLKWTTSTEINNKGFYVQRFYNGQWENIAFIATKAEGGNSTVDLNYTYNDVFHFKGAVQYRILQVDLDGKSKYSTIQSLSNGNQSGSILVYPNPAPANGNLSIVLPDASSVYDIQLVDNSGRIVKEYVSVRNTQQVSHLPKGQYLARVIERTSGQVTVEKIIVQ